MTTTTLKKITKDYGNGNVTTLEIGPSATYYNVNQVEPKFFATPHGSRESVTWHRVGFIVSATDNVVHPPVRRRHVFLWVHCPDENRWMTWSLRSVGSIREGERLIDEIMETGVIPNTY